MNFEMTDIWNLFTVIIFFMRLCIENAKVSNLEGYQSVIITEFESRVEPYQQQRLTAYQLLGEKPGDISVPGKS